MVNTMLIRLLAKLGIVNGLLVKSGASLGQVEVYISGSHFEAWKHTQLIIDVVPGRGGMFSLDNGREKRFLTRSRLLSNEGIEDMSG